MYLQTLPSHNTAISSAYVTLIKIRYDAANNIEYQVL